VCCNKIVTLQTSVFFLKKCDVLLLCWLCFHKIACVLQMGACVCKEGSSRCINESVYATNTTCLTKQRLVVPIWAFVVHTWDMFNIWGCGCKKHNTKKQKHKKRELLYNTWALLRCYVCCVCDINESCPQTMSMRVLCIQFANKWVFGWRNRSGVGNTWVLLISEFQTKECVVHTMSVLCCKLECRVCVWLLCVNTHEQSQQINNTQ